ncbi:MAG TPA: beta-ketoacyl-ACP synthase III [Anaerolineales bacterium]
MPTYAHITGWGMAVPERIMTNDDLAKIVDTSDEWIVSRTGIRERRIAGDKETTASLATKAAFRALDRTDLHPHDIDMVIVATATPEHLFPATACLVQDAIGAINAGAFDLSAACSGFIYGVSLASEAIRGGAIRNAVVIGSETLSRFIDWDDRETCILFGDGAGAIVLQASERPGGILASVMRADGSGGNLLSIPAGGSRRPATVETVHKKQHYIQMNGREVFRFATRVMADATRQVAEKARLRIEDLSIIIPHQANRRIIEAAARGLDLPMDRFFVNLDRYGNTSSASIPMAVVEAVEAGRITPGSRVVMVGFGAGLTWGALAVEWVAPERKISQAKRQQRRLRARFWGLRSVYRRFVRWIEGLIFGAHVPGDENDRFS